MSDIQTMIHRSSFTVLDSSLYYFRFPADAPIPNARNLLATFRDNDELTVIAEAMTASKGAEGNCYGPLRAVALSVAEPFKAVGFLAHVTGSIARQGFPVLVLSSYSKDYILLRDEHFARVYTLLVELGFQH